MDEDQTNPAAASTPKSCGVTGASGFIGRVLCEALIQQGWAVRALVRSADVALPPKVEPYAIGDLSERPNCTPAMRGLQVIFHLAARVHQLHETEASASSLYHRINCEATIALAQAAAAAGVKRFVFVSSIKVNGDATPIDCPFRENDMPAPRDDYANSKWLAEKGLAKVAAETGLGIVIIRVPLVYGVGVGANFLRLARLIRRGWVLPLGRVHNLRSLVYVENLVDALIVCGKHQGAVGKTFLISDSEPISTPDLVRRISRALGVPARLISVPLPILRVAATLFGRAEEFDRLTKSLAIDSRAVRTQLGWKQPFSMDEGLRKTIEANIQR